MIVVSDTTPINYLVQIDLIDLIPRLYRTAFIPPSVVAELLHPEAPPAVRAWASKLPEWIVVRETGATEHIAGLHRGEQDAISLAESIQARILLTDDLKARIAAHERGIATVTTLLILDTAAGRGWISFEDSLARLLETNFRVDRFTIDQLKAKHR
jgi:predicted nucleic acid-binding protein